VCRNCQHWNRREAFEERGTRFAPCALMPDRQVADRRLPGGKEWQAYVMGETYACAKFEKAE